MTTDIEHILPGFRTVNGELINAMIDRIAATGVASVSVVTANGVSGSVANPTTTPAITLTLGAITPSSVAAAGAVTGSNLSGTNTGDQTIILTGDVTGAGTGSFATTIANLAVTNAKLAGSIAASKLIGTDIATIGTITSGTWTGTVIGAAYGGTGVANNAASTLTISGSFGTTLTVTGTTSVTLPTSGTLVNSTSNSIAFTGGSITGMPNPMLPADVANKAYVDSVASGSSTIAACTLATTTALTVTYNNNAAGVGATLTNADIMAALSIDGVVPSVNDRILVKDQVSTFQNGVYSVTTVGSGAVNWVLTRTTDYDQPAEILNGSTAVILSGTAYPTGNLGTQWFQNSATPTTVGTDPITFSIRAANFLIASSNLADVVSASSARTNLGLGTIATQAASSVTITGGSIIGITDIAVADGGTGSSTASGARTNLGLGTIATQAANSVAITGGAIDGAILGATTPMQIQGYRPINAQTGTTHTLVLGDSGQLVTLSNASAITLTVPTNASVAFATNTEIDLAQLGAGQVTIAAAGGVTINSYGGNPKLTGQYAGATLKKTGTNTWLLIGNLSA